MYVNKKYSSKKIGEYYGVYGSTILKKLHLFNIPVRQIGSGDRPNALYTVDSTFFDNIDTPEKAYVLGYVTSDGHISKKDHIMFLIDKRDIDILHKVRSSMVSSHPIRYKTNSIGEYAILNIGSSIMCNRLREMGLNNRKTYGFDFERLISYVPVQFERDMIRGMFDGDGSICIYKYNYFNKHSYHLGYTGIKPVCDYIQERFGLNTKMINEGNNIYTVVSACRADIVRIGHYMYDDATIYMDRKKNTFDEVYALAELES